MFVVLKRATRGKPSLVRAWDEMLAVARRLAGLSYATCHELKGLNGPFPPAQGMTPQ